MYSWKARWVSGFKNTLVPQLTLWPVITGDRMKDCCVLLQASSNINLWFWNEVASQILQHTNNPSSNLVLVTCQEGDWRGATTCHNNATVRKKTSTVFSMLVKPSLAAYNVQHREAGPSDNVFHWLANVVQLRKHWHIHPSFISLTSCLIQTGGSEAWSVNHLYDLINWARHWHWPKSQSRFSPLVLWRVENSWCPWPALRFWYCVCWLTVIVTGKFDVCCATSPSSSS